MTKTKVLRFSLDYLKFNYPRDQKMSDFAMLMINAKNGEHNVKFLNTWFEQEYDVIRKNGILKLKYKGHTVIQIKQYNVNDQVGGYISYAIDFYSSFFSLKDMWPLYQEFDRKYAIKGKVSRVDICCDLNISVGDFIKAGYKTNFKKSNTYGVDLATGVPETIYFGSKASRNKRHLIRIYDKLLDTTNRKKYELYKDYFNYNAVTRVEIELRSTSCKELGLSSDNIRDRKTLQEVFTSICINPRTTHFQALDDLSLKTSKVRKMTVKREVEALKPEKKFKRLAGMAYNLFNAGYTNICIQLFDELRERGAYQNQEELLELQENITNYLNE